VKIEIREKWERWGSRGRVARTFRVAGCHDRASAIRAIGIKRGWAHPTDARLVAGTPRAIEIGFAYWHAWVKYWPAERLKRRRG
jgi:hypothetical protein